MLREQILSIRANAAMIVTACDQALAAQTTPSDGPCTHEQRIPAPRMGRESAWVCVCGAEGDE